MGIGYWYQVAQFKYGFDVAYSGFLYTVGIVVIIFLPFFEKSNLG